MNPSSPPQTDPIAPSAEVVGEDRRILMDFKAIRGMHTYGFS